MPLTDTVQTVQIGPICADQPCGVDLEYDAEFMALQQAASGRSEQQFGDAMIPAVAPDWPHVEALAVELLARTVDLRIVALLTLAWTEMKQFAGYAMGLALAADILDRYWDHVHPQLQVAGEFDPLPRFNAIASLTDPQALGRAARSATLLHWKFGQLSLRDAAAILDNSENAAARFAHLPGINLDQQLKTSLVAAREEYTVVTQSLDAIDRIERRTSANLGSSWTPDSSAVKNPLQIIYQVTRETAHANQASATQHLESPSSRTTDPAAEMAAPGVDGATQGPISIQSRRDVLVALENICVYLDRAEPTHPAPLLLRRVQRLLQMSFYEIVRDMAPAGLPQLDVLTGEAQQQADIANT